MRVLVVVAEPADGRWIRDRCLPLLAEGHEVAVCCVLPPLTSLEVSLEIQRRVTSELRNAFDGSAETIPVFVASGQDGVDECARGWGAADVRR
jgi:hypothetical protein